ncbi:MAG: hypothetical protein A2745_02725 [Candidatus Harrisonbacteria bacterium RIFCSPHIGHO2_01_FULL_44_13]|nr:MAG: hypothetical protein A2745_02725 [Candidatus Harrisonbacteria bacterium RIFCSPHIGHO2_01_FULL_44_13]
MKNPSMKPVCLFYRQDNFLAIRWANKIEKWLNKRGLSLSYDAKNPRVVIALGGDGTILEAARKYQNSRSIIIGLNLGQIGFLASVREPKRFLPALEKFFNGQYEKVKRTMIEAAVIRDGKKIFSTNALNDIAIQDTLGLMEIEVSIEKCPVQYIRGTGVLISTATGSTAYNLSAHGPIVMPDIKCLILTELLDHNIPTPSIVIERDREITLKINNFRKRGLLSLTKTGAPVDVILAADGEIIFSIEKGDLIKVTGSPRLITFAELDKDYFFKSLREKFAFK